MGKIIGNTTATTSPQSDWTQTDSKKADYIKNKPDLGNIAGKNEITKADLSADIQGSLDKADTALQSYTESDPIFASSAAYGISSSDITTWHDKYVKPTAGIPKTDLASDIQASLDKADTALQDHQSLEAYRTSADQDIIDATKEVASNKVVSVSSSSTDTEYPSAKAVYLYVTEVNNSIHTHENKEVLDTITQDKINLWDDASTLGGYVKPSTGIPKTDLASDVQTSLERADTALQSHQSLSEYRTASDQDAIDIEKESKSNKVTSISFSSSDTEYPSAKAVYSLISGVGSTNHTHENKDVLDIITQTKIDQWDAASTSEAYVKPSTGIPKSDLDSDVQTSLNNADTALQSYTETDPVFVASAAYGISSSDINIWNFKYVKPSTGIPKTDFATDVQTSLDKADTALQNHQSLSAYRTSAAQDVIDAEKESTSNKVESVSSSSTDIEYPSAKAVYEYVSGEVGNIHTHTNKTVLDTITASETWTFTLSDGTTVDKKVVIV